MRTLMMSLLADICSQGPRCHLVATFRGSDLASEANRPRSRTAFWYVIDVPSGRGVRLRHDSLAPVERVRGCGPSFGQLHQLNTSLLPITPGGSRHVTAAEPAQGLYFGKYFEGCHGDSL